MKPFLKHVAIAVDGGIKGGIGITETTEFIAEIAEGAVSASSVSFSGFSDSPFGRWLDAWLTGLTEEEVAVVEENP